MAPNHGKEHDARDTIRLYKYSMSEDEIEFGESPMRAPTLQEMKITEFAAAYSYCDMDKFARIAERDEQCHRCKAYHRNVCQYRSSISKA